MTRRPALDGAPAPGFPNDVGALWWSAMQRGDFEAAWRQTDRIELPRRTDAAAGTLVREPHHLLWNGEPFEGRHVLVRCDHGLGDTLQFIRYVPLLTAIARRVTVLVQPHLVSLLAGCDGYGDVRNGWTDEAPPPHDVEIEIMELAYAFRSTVSTLPARVPYVPASLVRARAPQVPRIAPDGFLRVGLAWAASDWDPTRSIPLAALAPLATVSGLRFYSVQQGAAATFWRDAPITLEPFSRHTAEVAALGAAMLDLDLVITIDSMVAHLAGALGRRVWVLLKHEADWRWMQARTDSPWYPTMRLFRQARADDWSGVAHDVAKMLVHAVADARETDVVTADSI